MEQSGEFEGIHVSIIIVSWKVKALVLDCIQSVYQFTKLPEKNFEIFLIDNVSDDGTVAAVRDRFENVRVIENKKNVGFGAANNQAYEYCKGRYVLLLNPDTVLLDDAIGKMCQYMENHEAVGVMGCRLLNADHSLQRWTAGAFPSLANAASHYLFLNRILPSFLRIDPLYLEQDISHDKEVDWVSGACLILRREKTGPTIFNSSFFMYGEDMELCYRMKKAGNVIAYYPGASIVHFQGKSMEQQEGEILLQALKGPRNFYTQLRGTRFAFLFDAFAASGFFLRWVVYGLLSLVGRDDAMKKKAKMSRRYLVIGFKVLFRQ